MTEYVWSDLRDTAIQAFGNETPGAETEQAIIDAFQRTPALVAAEIPRVADDKRTGRVRSGWAVLRARLEAATAQSDITATDANERNKAIRNAEQWIRVAGIHHDRETEILDELYGNQGRLRTWATDTDLRDRMLTLWRSVRPAGEQVEQDATERAEHWNQTTGQRWRLERDPAYRKAWVDDQHETIA